MKTKSISNKRAGEKEIKTMSACASRHYFASLPVQTIPKNLPLAKRRIKFS
jgi:hypothetical protein